MTPFRFAVALLLLPIPLTAQTRSPFTSYGRFMPPPMEALQGARVRISVPASAEPGVPLEGRVEAVRGDTLRLDTGGLTRTVILEPGQDLQRWKEAGPSWPFALIGGVAGAAGGLLVAEALYDEAAAEEQFAEECVGSGTGGQAPQVGAAFCIIPVGIATGMDRVVLHDLPGIVIGAAVGGILGNLAGKAIQKPRWVPVESRLTVRPSVSTGGVSVALSIPR